MKNSFKIILVVFAFLSLSFVNFNNREINIVIDAGHGGLDHGAKIDYISEKLVVAEITKKIQLLHKDANVKIHFTREDDSFVELIKRAAFINEIKPDLAISLHVNQNLGKQANGFEIFISDKSAAFEKSKELAEKFSEKFSEKSPLNNRGIKTAPFMVLKKSNYPTMLIELGYISNENDRNYLTSDKGQTEVAQTILDFASSLK